MQRPVGDVRAPFSIHYKTGLISVPLSLDQFEDFEPKDAGPLSVMKHIDKYAEACEVALNYPTKLLEITESA